MNTQGFKMNAEIFMNMHRNKSGFEQTIEKYPLAVQTYYLGQKNI